eukprot:TRINITY_DN8342_c0_g1_i1.p1 TRINITY_DN8342_c0_g1~~TRINITY_DN8342_c0_g1_i1.p1  ORF type:complete len:1297 (+),score=236.30 TRINITY_DN8342_c0_g1_i1:32-3892(+)
MDDDDDWADFEMARAPPPPVEPGSGASLTNLEPPAGAVTAADDDFEDDFGDMQVAHPEEPVVQPPSESQEAATGLVIAADPGETNKHEDPTQAAIPDEDEFEAEFQAPPPSREGGQPPAPLVASNSEVNPATGDNGSTDISTSAVVDASPDGISGDFGDLQEPVVPPEEHAPTPDGTKAAEHDLQESPAARATESSHDDGDEEFLAPPTNGALSESGSHHGDLADLRNVEVEIKSNAFGVSGGEEQVSLSGHQRTASGGTAEVHLSEEQVSIDADPSESELTGETAVATQTVGKQEEEGSEAFIFDEQPMPQNLVSTAETTAEEEFAAVLQAQEPTGSTQAVPTSIDVGQDERCDFFEEEATRQDSDPAPEQVQDVGEPSPVPFSSPTAPPASATTDDDDFADFDQLRAAQSPTNGDHIPGDFGGNAVLAADAPQIDTAHTADTHPPVSEADEDFDDLRAPVSLAAPAVSTKEEDAESAFSDLQEPVVASAPNIEPGVASPEEGISSGESGNCLSLTSKEADADGDFADLQEPVEASAPSDDMVGAAQGEFAAPAVPPTLDDADSDFGDLQEPVAACAPSFEIKVVAAHGETEGSAPTLEDADSEFGDLQEPVSVGTHDVTATANPAPTLEDDDSDFGDLQEPVAAGAPLTAPATTPASKEEGADTGFGDLQEPEQQPATPNSAVHDAVSSEERRPQNALLGPTVSSKAAQIYESIWHGGAQQALACAREAFAHIYHLDTSKSACGTELFFPPLASFFSAESAALPPQAEVTSVPDSRSEEQSPTSLVVDDDWDLRTTSETREMHPVAVVETVVVETQPEAAPETVAHEPVPEPAVEEEDDDDLSFQEAPTASAPEPFPLPATAPTATTVPVHPASILGEEDDWFSIGRSSAPKKSTDPDLEWITTRQEELPAKQPEPPVLPEPLAAPEPQEHKAAEVLPPESKRPTDVAPEWPVQELKLPQPEEQLIPKREEVSVETETGEEEKPPTPEAAPSPPQSPPQPLGLPEDFWEMPDDLLPKFPVPKVEPPAEIIALVPVLSLPRDSNPPAAPVVTPAPIPDVPRRPPPRPPKRAPPAPPPNSSTHLAAPKPSHTSAVNTHEEDDFGEFAPAPGSQTTATPEPTPARGDPFVLDLPGGPPPLHQSGATLGPQAPRPPTPPRLQALPPVQNMQGHGHGHGSAPAPAPASTIPHPHTDWHPQEAQPKHVEDDEFGEFEEAGIDEWTVAPAPPPPLQGGLTAIPTPPSVDSSFAEDFPVPNAGAQFPWTAGRGEDAANRDLFSQYFGTFGHR